MPYTIVLFHAHPDDEAIATGGTMARAKSEGHRVVLVSATRGELGEYAPMRSHRARRWSTAASPSSTRPARCSASTGSSSSTTSTRGWRAKPTNDAPGSFWTADIDEAAKRLAAILDEEHADVLTVYDENGNYGHPDHIQVHRVGVRAAELAGTRRVYEATANRDHIRRLMEQVPQEPGSPESPADLETLGVTEDQITTTVDVRDFVDQKRAAMIAHASQIPADSFFLQLPLDAFREAFGWEWFIRRDAAANCSRRHPLRRPRLSRVSAGLKTSRPDRLCGGGPNGAGAAE